MHLMGVNGQKTWYIQSCDGGEALGLQQPVTESAPLDQTPVHCQQPLGSGEGKDLISSNSVYTNTSTYDGELLFFAAEDRHPHTFHSREYLMFRCEEQLSIKHLAKHRETPSCNSFFFESLWNLSHSKHPYGAHLQKTPRKNYHPHPRDDHLRRGQSPALVNRLTSFLPGRCR